MLFASSAGGPVTVLDSFEALLSVVEVKDSRHWLFFLWQSDGQLQRSSVAVTPPRSRPPLHTSGNSRAWKGEPLPEKSDLSAHGHVLSSWHPRAFPSLHPAFLSPMGPRAAYLQIPSTQRRSLKNALEVVLAAAPPADSMLRDRG